MPEIRLRRKIYFPGYRIINYLKSQIARQSPTEKFTGSTGGVVTVDQAPAASNSVNIASYTSVTQNVPMRLIAVPGNGITVVPEGGQLRFPFLNTIPAGAVCLTGCSN